jgi:hypothetical protein
MSGHPRVNLVRRALLAAGGVLPALAWAGATDDLAATHLPLADFSTEPPRLAPPVRWRGFSDRVMGGVSEGEFRVDTVAGRRGARMTGRVTRDSGGGFIQMALDLAGRGDGFDASAWQGVEALVHGNDEDYNVHVRTADCGWYDESFRLTFRAPARWTRLRFGWSQFEPNGLDAPLDASRLQRVAFLGWMREFEADLAVAEVSLYA